MKTYRCICGNSDHITSRRNFQGVCRMGVKAPRCAFWSHLMVAQERSAVRASFHAKPTALDPRFATRLSTISAECAFWHTLCDMKFP